MDFVVGLPLIGRKHDSIWDMVDRLTKSSHFLPVRTDYSFDKLVELYIEEIVRLHGIPVSHFRHRSEVHFEILGKIARGFRHLTKFQHGFPPANGWII